MCCFSNVIFANDFIMQNRDKLSSNINSEEMEDCVAVPRLVSLVTTLNTFHFKTYHAGKWHQYVVQRSKLNFEFGWYCDNAQHTTFCVLYCDYIRMIILLWICFYDYIFTNIFNFYDYILRIICLYYIMIIPKEYIIHRVLILLLNSTSFYSSCFISSSFIFYKIFFFIIMYTVGGLMIIFTWVSQCVNKSCLRFYPYSVVWKQ